MDRSLESHQSSAARSVEAAEMLQSLLASGLTADVVATKLGVSARSVSRWLQLQTSPQHSHVIRIKELVSQFTKGI